MVDQIKQAAICCRSRCASNMVKYIIFVLATNRKSANAIFRNVKATAVQSTLRLSLTWCQTEFLFPVMMRCIFPPISTTKGKREF